MKTTLTLLTALLLFPMVPLHAQSSQADAAGVGYAVASRLEEFWESRSSFPCSSSGKARRLGRSPHRERRHGGGVPVARRRQLPAQPRRRQDLGRRHRDRSRRQRRPRLVDETKGDILYVNPAAGWLFRSRDSGATWTRERAGAARWIREHPEDRGRGGHAVRHHTRVRQAQGPAHHASAGHGAEELQCRRVAALPLQHRALQRRWRRVWQTSKPFPVLGTGEAALAELSDGSILYNSREHMSRGNHFLAHSDDGGDLWIGAYRSPDLPDGRAARPTA